MIYVTGRLPSKLIEEITNNGDADDCMAIVLLPDGKPRPVFVNCIRSTAE